MKIVKIALLLVAVLIVLLAAGVLVAFGMIDRIAAEGVERGGTYALGVPTDLDSADVGVFAGTVELGGLKVSNPEGFKSERFMTLGDGGLAVSLATLRQDVVEVPAITLTDIDVYLERSDGKANYQVIIDNLKRFESGDKPPPEKEPGKRFVIRRVEIKDVAAHVSLIPLGGQMSTVEVVVPEIVLTDVGADEPLKLGEIVNVITQALLATIAANAGGTLPADLAAELQSQLGQLDSLRQHGIDVAANFGQGLEQVAGSLEDLQGQVEGLRGQAEGVQKELEDAGDKLRGLLGGGDEKKDGGG